MNEWLGLTELQFLFLFFLQILFLQHPLICLLLQFTQHLHCCIILPVGWQHSYKLAVEEWCYKLNEGSVADNH